MLVISKRLPAKRDADLELVLPFDLRQKSRLRTKLDDGEEVGLFLERGSVLRDGDLLQADDGRVVRVRSRPEKLLHVVCGDDEQLLRVAYHLGNRHVALQVGDGWVRIASDDVLAQMVEGLGASVQEIEAPFEPETGAYGGHHHSHGAGEAAHEGGHGHGGVIHQFGKDAAAR